MARAGQGKDAHLMAARKAVEEESTEAKEVGRVRRQDIPFQIIPVVIYFFKPGPMPSFYHHPILPFN